jgi:hypothetical protein
VLACNATAFGADTPTLFVYAKGRLKGRTTASNAPIIRAAHITLMFMLASMSLITRLMFPFTAPRDQILIVLPSEISNGAFWIGSPLLRRFDVHSRPGFDPNEMILYFLHAWNVFS